MPIHPLTLDLALQGLESVADLPTIMKMALALSFFERTALGDIGLRQFHDDKPSHLSPVADLVNHYPIEAMNVIAHIRKATTGGSWTGQYSSFCARSLGRTMGICP